MGGTKNAGFDADFESVENVAESEFKFSIKFCVLQYLYRIFGSKILFANFIIKSLSQSLYLNTVYCTEYTNIGSVVRV